MQMSDLGYFWYLCEIIKRHLLHNCRLEFVTERETLPPRRFLYHTKKMDEEGETESLTKHSKQLHEISFLQQLLGFCIIQRLKLHSLTSGFM